MLSVILPAYNEKDMIPVAAETLAGILDKEGIAFELLFVNEPTRGIDIYSKELILDWLLKMNEDNNTTVVITSGELEELIRTCDRIVVMYQGKIFLIFEENLDIEEITLSLYGRDAPEV